MRKSARSRGVFINLKDHLDGVKLILVSWEEGTAKIVVPSPFLMDSIFKTQRMASIITSQN
ncbi:hypothetical protein CW304_01785 [Bacillus sp. UFRGS-B20]|nr:hypothetical protein CW304_01785 [Bacillus sp. UFRGS-B20]